MLERNALIEAIGFSFRTRMRDWEEARGRLLQGVALTVLRSRIDADLHGGHWEHANGLCFLGLSKPRLRWVRGQP